MRPRERTGLREDRTTPITRTHQSNGRNIHTGIVYTSSRETKTLSLLPACLYYRMSKTECTVPSSYPTAVYYSGNYCIACSRGQLGNCKGDFEGAYPQKLPCGFPADVIARASEVLCQQRHFISMLQNSCGMPFAHGRPLNLDLTFGMVTVIPAWFR